MARKRPKPPLYSAVVLAAPTVTGRPPYRIDPALFRRAYERPLSVMAQIACPMASSGSRPAGGLTPLTSRRLPAVLAPAAGQAASLLQGRRPPL